MRERDNIIIVLHCDHGGPTLCFKWESSPTVLGGAVDFVYIYIYIYIYIYLYIYIHIYPSIPRSLSLSLKKHTPLYLSSLSTFIRSTLATSYLRMSAASSSHFSSEDACSNAVSIAATFGTSFENTSSLL